MLTLDIAKMNLVAESRRREEADLKDRESQDSKGGYIYAKEGTDVDRSQNVKVDRFPCHFCYPLSRGQ